MSVEVLLTQQRQALFRDIQERRSPSRLTAPRLGGESVDQHIAKGRALVEEMFVEAAPRSSQEYLALALNEGLNALEDGNYGIGAVIVVRERGKEYVIAGHNRLRSEKTSHPHAEEDAFDALEGLRRGEKKWKERILIERDLPSEEADVNSVYLVTSLEPCPGCVRRLLTHKIDGVIIGEEDPYGGAMLGGRENLFAQVWIDMRKSQGLKVQMADYDNIKSPYYVNPKYRALIKETFDINREAIDQEMKRQGLAGQGLIALALLSSDAGVWNGSDSSYARDEAV